MAATVAHIIAETSVGAFDKQALRVMTPHRHDPRYAYPAGDIVSVSLSASSASLDG
jgi:hypothetical protein